MTPFWSLGWWASSYNYKTLATYDEVIANYSSNGIPLEGVFFDIPYLANGADFSVNTTTFPNLKQWSQDFHKKNMKVVPIIDGGISADDLENYYYSNANN